MKNELYIGIDIGGTKISAGLVDSKGKISYREKVSVPKSGKSQDILDEVFGLLKDLVGSMDLGTKNLKGIGIGVPGIVDSDHRTILVTPNINLDGFPLAERIRKKYKTQVVIGNDVNFGLLGEKWLGAGRKFQNIIGIFPGTGVGGGIILQNKLITGTRGAAAEIGHMIMDINGPLCSCGNTGCLEALASRWAIERDIRDAIKKKKKTIVTKLTNGDIAVIKSKIIREALKLKDPLMTKIMSRVSITLGKACISIKHIFNPQLIILGGGIIEACGDFIMPRVQKVANSDPFFSDIDNCRVVQSQLGDDAVILGAVAMVKGDYC